MSLSFEYIENHCTLEYWVEGVREMSRANFAPEQIIGRLRYSDVAQACGRII